jgi:AhpD family alkylhydroperoxidase
LEVYVITETLREKMAKTIKYIEPVQYSSAMGLAAEIYQQMQDDFLPVPPLTLHSPVPEVMAGAWSILRETLRTGHVDRALKEAVAAMVSKTNTCLYCVDVHTSMLHATSNHDAASAILRGDYDSIHNARIKAIVEWVLANRLANGNGKYPLPFSHGDAPELIGTAVVFHYLNRMVNVFLSDTPFALPSPYRGLAGRLFGATAGKILIRSSIRRGDSLKFIPKAKLPDDLSWAASNPIVARAFAGFAQIIEEAGQKILPEEVHTLVRDRVRVWNGQAMGISRKWVEDLVIDVAEEHRAAARLTLLTALASYQIDTSVIEEFQSQYPEDSQLIAATAWASFTAARRAGEWLAAPFKIAM